MWELWQAAECGAPSLCGRPFPTSRDASSAPLLFSRAGIQSRVDVTVGKQVRGEICVGSDRADSLQLLPTITQVRKTFRTFCVSTCILNSSRENFLLILCFYMPFNSSKEIFQIVLCVYMSFQQT